MDWNGLNNQPGCQLPKGQTTQGGGMGFRSCQEISCSGRGERAHKPQIFLIWHFNHHPPYPHSLCRKSAQVLFIQLAFKLPIFNWFWTNINHNARFLFTIAERAVAERFGNWNESIVLSRLLLSNMEKYLCLAKTVLLQHLCMQHKQSLCNLCHCLLIWY